MTDRQKHTESMQDPGISRLYRATRREEPSAQLDARILAKAQAAARHRRRRWLLPLSSAAVVLLGLTFTLKLLEQAPHPQLQQIGEGIESVPSAETKIQPKIEKHSVQPAPTRLFDSPSESFKRKSLSPAPASRSMGGMLDSQPADDRFEALERDSQQVERADTPEQWLARIQGYLERGDRPQALSELKAFLERYPDHPLPEALQGLD